MSEGGTIGMAYEVGGTCRLTRMRVAAGALWLGTGKERRERGASDSMRRTDFEGWRKMHLPLKSV